MENTWVVNTKNVTTTSRLVLNNNSWRSFSSNIQLLKRESNEISLPKILTASALLNFHLNVE